jgi:hypothetical protein
MHDQHTAYPLSDPMRTCGASTSTTLFAEFQNFGQTLHHRGQRERHTAMPSLTFTAPLRPDFSLDQSPSCTA